MMKLTLPFLMICSLAVISPGYAQSVYPNKPVKIVVPFTPGGSSDILARAIGGELSKSLGQSFVIENVAGAGGSIGSDRVAKSAADGYTLLLASGSMLTVNPQRDGGQQNVSRAKSQRTCCAGQIKARFSELQHRR